ncbi:hypothetical protein [Dietzia sp. 179-F 9C3 NHS]|uniref:hypothetical protein n=1 Tax=Dietzia sp. 179-F 9C3 NHS TaxID=3374295 RepID=UPI00387906B5
MTHAPFSAQPPWRAPGRLYANRGEDDSPRQLPEQMPGRAGRAGSGYLLAVTMVVAAALGHLVLHRATPVG